jgi:hypothetical protein
MSIPTELFTWEMLATLFGAATAVFILVQLTKQFIPAYIPVRLYAWVLAWCILSLAALVLGSLTWQVLALNLLNGAIIALTAMGEYALASTAGLAKPRSD